MESQRRSGSGSWLVRSRSYWCSSGFFASGSAPSWRSVDSGGIIQTMDDYEVIAQELSELAEKIRGLEERLADMERDSVHRCGLRPQQLRMVMHVQTSC